MLEPTFTDLEPTFTDLLPAGFDDSTLRDDVLRGLATAPRSLAARWFYDKVGSELFEEITRLPEYYATRTERGILTRHAGAVIEAAAPTTLVELGSGSSQKTTLLLDALVERLRRTGGTPRYLALDVSEHALRGAADDLRPRYRQLAVDLVRADFTTQLDRLPDVDAPPRLFVFLGSTIGNFEPGSRARFLAQVQASLLPGEHLLLGADLVKPADVLVPAYDDAAGVTSAFNLNVLEVLRHRLGGDLDRSAFAHRAVWDGVNEWIEMRLLARRATRLRLEDVDLTIDLAAGEEIRTEVSAKFRRDRLTAELREAGFAPAGWWTDERDWFSVSLWRRS